MFVILSVAKRSRRMPRSQLCVSSRDFSISLDMAENPVVMNIACHRSTVEGFDKTPNSPALSAGKTRLEILVQIAFVHSLDNGQNNYAKDYSIPLVRWS